MKDLLGTVKADGNGVGRYSESNADLEAAESLRPASATPQDKALQEFFQQVADIKSLLESIKKSRKKLQELHDKQKAIARSDKSQELQKESQDTVSSVSICAKKAKDKIELLDLMNAQAANQEGNEVGSCNQRMRASVTNGLKKKLKEIMGDFQSLRTKIQEEYREVVARRMTCVNGHKPSPEELDRMIDSGEAEAIFKKAILEPGRGSINDTLAEIQERHGAVKELEKSVLELNQLFLDMAVLVEAQGEMLDNIEKQVSQSSQYVKKGREHLEAAQVLQRGTRKYMCYAMICLAILAVLIFVVLGGMRLF